MSKDTAADLAEYVRTRRLRAGMTQESLAERSGLTVDTVGALERGLRKRLYPHTARAIADALNFTDAERAELAELAHGRVRPVRELVGAETASESPSEPVTPPAAPQPTPPATELRRHNLPASLTALIGRERELANIQARLSQTRILTLTGTGGVGKTRLAVEAASALLPHYADGAWLVELAPVEDAELVLPAIAQVLDVRESPGQPLLLTLSASLHEQHMMLVLDNCEQVLAAGPDIAALLMACPAVTVLATSRAPLRISGEHELLVPPLAAPIAQRSEPLEVVASYPAVRLFVERAAAVSSNFALTAENAASVVAICARLDGLPLAVELAAARVKLFSPQSVLARLDQRLGFLTGGAHDRPARQRTLRAAIAWSHDLLSPPERALFRRLGVFFGGFTLSAAEHVCADDTSASLDLIDTLASLVNSSLLEREELPGASGEAGSSESELEPRFTMLETIREFALDQLAEQGEADNWHERHLVHFLHLMERTEHDLRETVPVETIRLARRRLAPEYANLRAALSWAISNQDSERALRLAASLCVAWVPAGSPRVARPWLDHTAGTMEEARRWLEQCLAIEAPAPAAARARALHGLGRVLLLQWDNPAEERAAAVRAFERSLQLYRELDDRHGIARCLIDLGGAMFDLEELPTAIAHFGEGLAVSRALGSPASIGWSLNGLGRIAHAQGEDERAAALIEDGIAHHREAGNPLGVAAGIDGLGLVRQAQRDYPAAFQCFEEAVALRRTVGAQSGLPIALQRLAILLSVAGEPQRSSELMRESLALSYQMRNPLDIANGLLTFGALAGSQGHAEHGARLFGAGEAILQARGLVVPADYRGLYSRAVASVRRRLGDQAFEQAHTEGAALTMEQAIAEAVREPESD